MAFLPGADFSVCFQMEEKHERHTAAEKRRRFMWPSFLPLSDFSIFFRPAPVQEADKRFNKNRGAEKKARRNQTSASLGLTLMADADYHFGPTSTTAPHSETVASATHGTMIRRFRFYAPHHQPIRGAPIEEQKESWHVVGG